MFSKRIRYYEGEHSVETLPFKGGKYTNNGKSKCMALQDIYLANGEVWKEGQVRLVFTSLCRKVRVR